jgi:hypothetical protein
VADVKLERSPEARALAEQALAWLLHNLNGDDVEIVVLGGLVPEILTRGQDPPVPQHLGTTDVDLLLVTHIPVGGDLGPVENALKSMGFSPVDAGWRWRGRVDGQPVKIEFLCDLDTEPEFKFIELNGCSELGAQNLRGTGYVSRDWAWEELKATLPDGSIVEVAARFARLGGYLLSKCVAARTRGAEKDFYDLAYVLLHNRAGGPRDAAEEINGGALQPALGELRSTLLEIRERYRTPNAVGPAAYAHQMRILEPDSGEAELRADAVSAVREFLGELDGSTGVSS